MTFSSEFSNVEQNNVPTTKPQQQQIKTLAHPMSVCPPPEQATLVIQPTWSPRHTTINTIGTGTSTTSGISTSRRRSSSTCSRSIGTRAITPNTGSS